MSKKTNSKKTASKKNHASKKPSVKALPRVASSLRPLRGASAKADAAARAAEAAVALGADTMNALEETARDLRATSKAAGRAAARIERKTHELPAVVDAGALAVDEEETRVSVPRAGTMTQVAEELIASGATDERVTDTLAAKFSSDFDPIKRRAYASWFRARMVRQGKITAEFADNHRHVFDDEGKVVR